MPTTKRTTSNQIILFSILLLGIGLFAFSAFLVSSFLAIIGVAFIFVGAILIYITPSKYVSQILLFASAEAVASNIERLISEENLCERGIYLPPKNLENIESSLVFIPRSLQTQLPSPEETNEKLFTNKKTGVLITPPGMALSHLFEGEQGFSFTKTNLKQIQNNLPKLIVEDLELAEKVEIQIQVNNLIVVITNSIFNGVCIQTDSQPKTHRQVGCILSSAIACTLAKATGKPITIQSEYRDQKTKTTHVEYQIFEE
jgi:hypothetical protein